MRLLPWLRCRRTPGLLLLLLMLLPWLRCGRNSGLLLLLLLPPSRLLQLLSRLLLLLLLPAGGISRRQWWRRSRSGGPVRAGGPGATLARAHSGPLTLRGGLRNWGPVTPE